VRPPAMRTCCYRRGVGFPGRRVPLRCPNPRGFPVKAVASPEGRRQATAWIAENWEHILGELIAHQLAGAARCDGAARLIAYASQAEWTLDAEHIECPVRVV
jgi:hypothetical protein